MPASRLLRQRFDLARAGKRPEGRRGEAVAGTLLPKDMNGLDGLLATSEAKEGEVRVEMEFARDAGGFVVVEGRVEGELPVVCQRCLEVFDWPLRHRFRLALEDEAARGKTAPADIEVVEVHGGSIVPANLVTEEILLALPLAPVHGDGAQCEPVRNSTAGQLSKSHVENEKVQPFAHLGDWLPGKDKSD